MTGPYPDRTSSLPSSVKIVFLQSALRDLVWFRRYYASVFPAGTKSAQKQFAKITETLSAHPFIGHPSEGYKDVRELHIPRTPFTVIYRVTELQIEVLRLWDERQGGSI